VSNSDLGYFGPGSATWRIHGEPISMVGGLRALLLQALHPDAMRLLYEKSNFQDDPWQRLHQTVGYIATVSFAPRAEVDAAARRVRDVHGRLGVDSPEQLRWVHACLVDSFLAAASAAGLPIDATERDRYVAEQAVAAELVGVPADLIPHTTAQLAEVFHDLRPSLAATPQARAAARVVIAPPLPVSRTWAVPARIGWTTVSSLAVGLLPPWARRMYRLPPIPGAGWGTAAGMRVLRGAVRSLPARYREGPTYRAAKARAAAAS
jgi:uncharacterized protein (DUF2236 family)